jgi:hypothetical protein
MFKGSIFTFNMYCFEKYLHNILYLSKEGLAKITEKVNRFFYSSELKQEKEELVEIQHVLSQSIWLNPLKKIGVYNLV